jgi:hypothetical protein
MRSRCGEPSYGLQLRSEPDRGLGSAGNLIPRECFCDLACKPFHGCRKAVKSHTFDVDSGANDTGVRMDNNVI